MFKRIRWITAGLAAGFGASLWLQRKMRSVATRYRPAGVAVATADRAREALKEGRIAMREREAELRSSRPRERGSGPGRPAGSQPGGFGGTATPRA